MELSPTSLAGMPHIGPRTWDKPVAMQARLDLNTSPAPGTDIMRYTIRSYHPTGPIEGIDTFASIEDATAAAKALTSRHNPGMAVMQWRGGYRLHDLRTTSRQWEVVKPDMQTRSHTKLVKSSNVPFAAGNIFADKQASVTDARLAAVVDGDVTYTIAGAGQGSELPRLVRQ